MSTFVIAKKDSLYLESPVFQAGSGGNEEAIAVFSSRSAAQDYLDQAGWTDDHEVGELGGVQLLHWMLQAHEQGTEFAVIDPDRQEQTADKPQQVISIAEKLEDAGRTLTAEIVPA